jgi:putative tryptophan/tyrosine transport system substrate-binding protein
MRRRDVITLLGGTAAAWPLAARAQQRAFPVIGLLSSRSPAVDLPLIAVIRQALNETGLVEGQNVTLDYRWPRVNTIDWRDSPPISCVSKSPSLLQ